MIRTILLSVIAGAGLGAVTAPPVMAETSPVQQVAVAYGDLSLGTQAGDAALANRLMAAARRACDDAVVHSPLQPREKSECARDAAVRAAGEIGAPGVLLALNASVATEALASR
jgi:UrcA family protein